MDGDRPDRPRRARRSDRWFAADGMRAFAHRSRMQQVGWRREDFVDKPVIGILNTWSDLSTCHSHLRDRAASVKAAVQRAGGFAAELPALSLGEVLVKPTTMLYRNLLSMEAEELIRSHPLDGVVLMGGCDKTTPGLIMGAISAGLPFIYLPAGPTLNGSWRGETIGTGTHTRRYFDALRAGEISQEEWNDLETRMVRSVGTCNTMGTASTMSLLAEALGLSLPGAAATPAADSAHVRLAEATGARIADMVDEDLRPSDLLTRASFENAIIALHAIGGSTNAVIHLTAMAGRAGVALELADFERHSGRVPLIANLMPTGRFLMEDLFLAGGSDGLLQRLAPLLDLTAQTVTGVTLGEALAPARIHNPDIIRPLTDPVAQAPALAVLHGSLAPDGCVIKPSAAHPDLLVHRGRAVVFETYADMAARIDDPDLDVDETSILVLKGAGPLGGPGMPEWGGLPIPRKLLARGVRDMVRISDARMSGTHFGACILHVAPESALGGPLALVRNGDEIELDTPARRLDLLVDAAELERRRQQWTPPPPKFQRGYGVMFSAHILSAPRGCDFDFLEGAAPTAEPDIY